MRQLWSFQHAKPKVTLAPNVSSLEVIRAGQDISNSMPRLNLSRASRRLRGL